MLIDIKFRYTVRFKPDGEYTTSEIFTKILTLDEIENDELDRWMRSIVYSGYSSFDLVSKDMYTGMKDINGNEIYENDLVEYDYHEGRGVVTWDDEDACFFIDGHDSEADSWLHLFHDKRRWYKLEVVGNIHQELVR